MPSKAIATSPAIGRMLKERREALGLTLRAVASLSGERGHPIPYSTLARVEAGRLDPGVRRLQQLLRLYDLPSQVAGDLIDLEDLAGAIPFERDPAKLKKRALAAWHRGDVSEALACFLAFRDRTARTGELRDMRHEAIVSFAIAASSLGKHQLARHMLDALLLERPGPNVLVSLLVQQSVVWHALGSTEAALAFLDRAAAHVPRQAHKQKGWIHHQRGLVALAAGDWRSSRFQLGLAERAYVRADAKHDQALVLISAARLGYESARAGAALKAARRAGRFAAKHGFSRLRLFALLEESRALQLSGSFDASGRNLRRVLADPAAASDHVVRFHAHYYLWKAEVARGNKARADVLLRDAGAYLSFVDSSSPEAAEVRRLLRV